LGYYLFAGWAPEVAEEDEKLKTIIIKKIK